MIARQLLMFRLARRYISRRMLQSALFVLGVALGVAVGVAIDLANTSAKHAFALSAESITGRTTHQIEGGPSGLPDSLYRDLRLDLGLRQIAPIVTAYVRAAGLDEQPLRLLGVDVFAEAPFRDYLSTSQIEGQNQASFDALNLFLTRPATVLISASLAARFDLQPGDSLGLIINGARQDVTIAGLLTPSDSLSAQALDNLLLADVATAQELLGQPHSLTRIDLILPPDYDLARIEALLPQGALLTTPTASNDALSQMTAAFELNLRALSLLALVVGGFLIYNTVTFSVIQRRPVIGIMRALGATRRQIFAMILGEAALLGLIGTILGLALGIILGRAVVGLIAQTISDLYFAVSVERVTLAPGTLFTGAAIGLVTSLAAALIPSFEATRTPPAGTMRRSAVEQGARRITPYMTAAALGLNGLGVVLLVLPSQSIILGFIALFAIVVGCALLTPLALIAIMRAITPLTGRLLGVLGRIAPRDVVRSLSRTWIAVAALTVAVSVIVGVGVMIASFRGTVTDWLSTTLGADVFISPVSVTANRAAADLDPTLIETPRRDGWRRDRDDRAQRSAIAPITRTCRRSTWPRSVTGTNRASSHLLSLLGIEEETGTVTAQVDHGGIRSLATRGAESTDAWLTLAEWAADVDRDAFVATVGSFDPNRPLAAHPHHRRRGGADPSRPRRAFPAPPFNSGMPPRWRRR